MWSSNIPPKTKLTNAFATQNQREQLGSFPHNTDLKTEKEKAVLLTQHPEVTCPSRPEIPSEFFSCLLKKHPDVPEE